MQCAVLDAFVYFYCRLHKLDVNLGFALIPWMVYLPFLDGADTKTIKSVNLEMLCFVMACMSIGTVASSLGIGTALASLVEKTVKRLYQCVCDCGYCFCDSVCFEFLDDSGSNFCFDY